MNVRCFWLEPTGRAVRSQRRYASSDHDRCDASGRGYHDASTPLDVSDRDDHVSGDLWPHEDPRWPAACACGYAFLPSDTWQLFTASEYRRTDTGALTTLQSAAPGAMWNASWLADHPTFSGPDGRSIHVLLPNGDDWCIDAVCSNCDMPCTACGVPVANHPTASCTLRSPRPHKCWVRHGAPPNLTVDKNGVTCGAGAGSIWSRQGRPNEWHGFLRDGVLVPC